MVLTDDDLPGSVFVGRLIGGSELRVGDSAHNEHDQSGGRLPQRVLFTETSRTDGTVMALAHLQ